jgi:hypothetical protein
MRKKVIQSAPEPGRDEERSRECRESRLHFVAGAIVAGLFGRGDTGGKNPARVSRFAEAGKKLAELKIAGDVAGIAGEQLTKMLLRRRVIAEIRALDRETVACESVARIIANKAFESFAPRLGCLGHDGKSVS